MGVYKKGEDWYIDYYAFGRRKRQKIGPSKVLAENIFRKRKLEVVENRHLDIKKNEKIRFEDFADDFYRLYSRPNKKPLSAKRDLGLIKNLNSFFGGRYLYTITPYLIEEYKTKRSKEVSPATCNRELACLKTLFSKAVEWDKADSNPVKKVKLFKETNQRVRFLEKEEITKLLDNCSAHLKPIVIVALHTGMRKGEILDLKWHDIDIKRGTITLLDTKNNQRREVQMNNVVKRALIGVPKHPESPYIFCGKEGRPYTSNRKSFETALEKSGIMDFRFHDLRHTFASHLVMLGVDIKTVQELMGHKDIRMTLRYTHLSPHHKRRAIELFGDQMDTIWTPGLKQQDLEKKPSSITIDDKGN